MKDSFGKYEHGISVWFLMVGCSWRNDKAHKKHFALTATLLDCCNSLWRVNIVIAMISCWTVLQYYSSDLTVLFSTKKSWRSKEGNICTVEALDLKITVCKCVRLCVCVYIHTCIYPYRYNWQSEGLQFNSLLMYFLPDCCGALSIGSWGH